MAEPLENQSGNYHEDRRDMSGSSGDVNENIGRDSVRGNVTNSSRTIHVGRDYRETNVRDKGTYVEGDYYYNPEQQTTKNS